MANQEIEELVLLRNGVVEWLNKGSITFAKMAIHKLDDYLVSKHKKIET